MYLLTGDIGGTRARFRILDGRSRHWRIRLERNFPSHHFESFTEAVEYCLSDLSPLERDRIAEAWFAVAGPVHQGTVQFTNLPWKVDEETLAMELRLSDVHLINDLEALAHSIPALGLEQVSRVQEGQAGGDRGLVIAAGTGLGMAGWQVGPKGIQTFPSEGGHSDLAPVTDDDLALFQALRKRHEHVSWERVLSGPGLAELYDYRCNLARRRDIEGGDDENRSASRVTRLADRKNDSVAVEAIEQFTRLLGAFAGNAALHWMATGGVYLAGGVVAHLHSYLSGENFLEAFRAKGRMRALMERMPVSVITEADAGLEGISRLAMRRNHRAPDPEGQKSESLHSHP